MKRSEMLNIIASAIHPHRYDDDMSSMEIAELLLKYIEQAGMMPPPFNKEVHDINDDGIHYLLTYKLRINKVTGDYKSN